ncbi:MAG: nodulation protein NfeD, partial [Elusimicrobiota bacterium]
SAGVFITMASDVAAMAPSSNIGAAHPVNLGPSAPVMGAEKEGGKDASIMEQKAVSDASAYMESLTKEKGRNWQWAVSAVTESKSLTAQEAFKQGVIDNLADDLKDLFKQLDGKRIHKDKKEFLLRLTDAPVEEAPMDFMQRFMNYLAHPNIAYILLMLGIYGLIYEFSSPGVGLGAAIGGISLLLAFMSLQMLPINYTGLLLLLFGIALFILELKLATHGVLAIGGITALVLGSFMLIESADAYFRISSGIILTSAAATFAFFTYAIGAALDIQRKKPTTGKEGLLGQPALVTRDLDPEGMIMAQGELWQARSSQGVIGKGKRVIVESIDGNHLTVKELKD